MNVIKVARSEGTIKASTTSAALVSLRDIARKPAAPPAADSLTESLAALVVNSRGLIDSITTLAASQLAENAARDVTIETQKQYIQPLGAPRRARESRRTCHSGKKDLIWRLRDLDDEDEVYIDEDDGALRGPLRQAHRRRRRDGRVADSSRDVG